MHFPPSQEFVPAGEAASQRGQLFTAEHIADLLIGSFKFSQRDGAVAQDEILRYIACRYHSHLDDTVIEASFGPAHKIAQQIISDPTLHTAGYKGAGSEVYMIMSGLKLRLEERREPNLSVLTKQMIKLDKRSITGRSRTEPDPTNPDRDPHISYFVYYGLMSQNTGLPEYDQMFRELVNEYENNISNIEAWRTRVARLVAYYSTHHPEHVSRLPPQYRALAQAASTT